MSFTCRIADIDLTVSCNQVRDFGSILDGDRAVSFLAIIAGASKDDRAAQVSMLNSRLAAPCDLILRSNDSSHEQSLHLLGGGSANVVEPDIFELDCSVFASVTAPCAPYATPANRVFLASPYGDEFPSDATVTRNSAARVYAQNGRYVVTTDLADEGELRLAFECIDNELLVIEFDWELDSIAGAGNYLNIAALMPDGATWSTARAINLTAPAISGTSGHFVGTVESLPSSPSKTGYLHFASVNHAGAMLAYVWNVRVGVKQRIAGEVTDNRFVGDVMPAGWSTSSDYFHVVGGKLHMESTAAHGTVYGQSAKFPAIAGRRYGAGTWIEILARAGGTWSISITWRDAVGGSLGSSIICAAAAVIADTWYQVDAVAPALTETAEYTFSLWGVTGVCTGILHGMEFGEHLIAQPGAIHLEAIEGEIPAPLEILATALSDDMHILGMSVARADERAYLIEAETLVTTAGGATVWGTDVASSKLSGGHGRSNNSNTYIFGYFDTSNLRPMSYRLYVKAYEVTAGQTSWFYCGDNGQYATVTGQNAVWLDMGVISIPTSRTRLGTGSWANIRMRSQTGTAVCDCLYLLPLPATVYHPATSTEDATTLHLDADGTVYLDGAVNMASVVAAPLRATALDVLHVMADRNSADYAATKRCRVSIYATQPFNLWR